jgi:hypothetical protein
MPNTGSPGTVKGHSLSFAVWAAIVGILVIGGLFVSSRAGDAYMSISGLLFAAFGVFFGFRLLHRVLP